MTTKELLATEWADLEPHYKELAKIKLTPENVDGWLASWSRVSECVDEIYNRLYYLITRNTADEASKEKYRHFLDGIYPSSMAAEQKLKEILLDSKLEPKGFEIQIRNMRAEADLYCAENLPLLSEEQKLNSEYDRIISGQTLEWNGEEKTVTQMLVVLEDPDRSVREKSFLASMKRQLADRQEINELWSRMIDLRMKLASNAKKPDYRTYRWQQMLRFDYTPDDCKSFQRAIEEAVVPAARRVLEKRKAQLGVKQLRPWDLEVNPQNVPALKPFTTIDEYISKTNAIFNHVDPAFGKYFRLMTDEKLLDLDNRKNKAPGAYTTGFNRIRRPVIFANAIGFDEDVRVLLHESGHAFHYFESAHLPYLQQLNAPMEFAEVASMSMELLARPYTTTEYGGFYDKKSAAQSMIHQLEKTLLFWPYMAVVDAFQQWVYENPIAAKDGNQCDKTWGELWKRFMPVTDWSGLEDEMVTGWHRKLHIHTSPFYYVEYGLAQLGACQVWANALKDQRKSVAAYRKALTYGGTRTLPELYKIAGAKLAFDAGTLKQAVDLIEETLRDLEKI